MATSGEATGPAGQGASQAPRTPWSPQRLLTRYAAALGTMASLAILPPVLIQTALIYHSGAAGELARLSGPLVLLGVALIGVLLIGISMLPRALRRIERTIEALESAHEDIRCAEENYRSLFENAVEGIFQTSADGRYLSANPALARIYGYHSPEELIAKLTDIGEQLYVDRTRRDAFGRLLEAGDVVAGFESEIYRKDGSVIWILENARAVRDASGRLLRYEGNVQDITSRKRAEQALQSSEAELRSHRAGLERIVAERTAALTRLNEDLEREVAERRRAEQALRESQRRVEAREVYFRSLIEHASDVITILDGDRRLTYASGSLARVLGYDPARVRGVDLMAWIEPLDAGKMQSFWEDLLRHPGLGSPIHFRCRHADGSTRILETIGTNLLDDPAVKGVVLNTRDVTEREQAKAALYLRDHAIDSTSEGITISDPLQPDNPLVYVNSGFERLTGWTGLEVVGRNCRLLQGPDTDPAAVAEIRAAIAEERPCSVELLNYRKDGTPFWNLLSITPVRNSLGNVTNFVGVQFDVTARRRVERMKVDMVATVSHELRTPLASLRGFTELMLERELRPETQREFLTIINRESVRLSKLLDDFLDIQRMEAGRLAYDFAPVDLALLLAEMVAVFSGTSTTCRARLDVPRELPPARADAARVRQVVGNLLSNAIKFSPDGGDITVAVRQDGGILTVSVADQGVGMSPQDMEGLFTKFYRADNVATRHIGGTGLGLALVKEIIEAHGGEIRVVSEPGVGTTFAFTLPTAADLDAGLRRHRGPDHAPPAHPPGSP